MSSNKEMMVAVGIMLASVACYVLGFTYKLIHQVVLGVYVALTVGIVVSGFLDDGKEETFEEDHNC